MNNFTLYVTFIFIVKIIFIILAVSMLYIRVKTPKNTKLIESLKFWKERMELIFKAMISLMLIYLFNPRSNNIGLINKETKLLLFLFGFILIITANWSNIINESPLLTNFKNSKK